MTRTEEEAAIARYRREGRRQMKRRVENTASLELCMELYKLSGWNDTYFGWTSTNRQSAWVNTLPEDFAELNYPLITPAYDLGYLLRKFRGNGGVELRYGDQACIASSQIWTAEAETPEDAACELAIELFKHGVLKRS